MQQPPTSLITEAITFIADTETAEHEKYILICAGNRQNFWAQPDAVVNLWR